MTIILDAILASALSTATVAQAPVETSAKCGDAEMRTHYFAGAVGIAKRVIDRHRCGVIELRVVDSYDTAASTRTREVFRDLDHDGAFERYWTRVEPLRGDNADLAWGRVNPMATKVAKN